jgi:hypothetical protein
MNESEISQEEEFWHEPESDNPLWRESYYLDFYDPETGLSGFTSIGFRHNKGYMGSTTGLVWSGNTYLRKDYSRPTEQNKIIVEGLTYTPEIPLEGWNVNYSSPMNEFDLETEAMDINPHEFPVDDKPLYAVTIDLKFEGLHPPVDYHRDASERDQKIISPVYSRHYEQACSVSGSVEIGDETIKIDGFGQRDHSWGIRDWRGPDAWTWIGAVFDGKAAASFIEITTDGKSTLDGYLYLNGLTLHVNNMLLNIEYRDDNHTQERLHCTISDSKGRELQLVGEPETIIPIDFEYEDGIGRLRRGPTQFSIEGENKIGHGWSELLRSEQR